MAWAELQHRHRLFEKPLNNACFHDVPPKCFLNHHLNLRPPFEPFLTILRLGAESVSRRRRWRGWRGKACGGHRAEGNLRALFICDPARSRAPPSPATPRGRMIWVSWQARLIQIHNIVSVALRIPPNITERTPAIERPRRRNRFHS